VRVLKSNLASVHGPLEATQNKSNLLKQSQSYGYRALKFFQIKLLALHLALHAFVG